MKNRFTREVVDQFFAARKAMEIADIKPMPTFSNNDAFMPPLETPRKTTTRSSAALTCAASEAPAISATTATTAAAALCAVTPAKATPAAPSGTRQCGREGLGLLGL